MGILFSCGSRILDLFGARESRKLDEDESEDDIDHEERIEKDVKKMENYCKPLIFVKFYGQTNLDKVRKVYFYHFFISLILY